MASPEQWKNWLHTKATGHDISQVKTLFEIADRLKARADIAPRGPTRVALKQRVEEAYERAVAAESQLGP